MNQYTVRVEDEGTPPLYLASKSRPNVFSAQPDEALRFDLRTALAAVGRLALVVGPVDRVTIERV